MRRHTGQHSGKLILVAAMSAAGLTAVALGLFRHLLAAHSGDTSRFKSRADVHQGGGRPSQVAPPGTSQEPLLVPQPGPTAAPPKLQGMPAGEALTFEPDEKDLRASILALPMPEVWLEFPGPRGPTPPPTTEDAASGSPVKAQHPRAARKIL